ncbi:MAG: GGDEF domain-containing protein, partial [Candidatus Eremiobacteraeota bacterium]|nr:GGDEF domain-containing protein [Candidatus Eremiobacteraeota bacterium]
SHPSIAYWNTAVRLGFFLIVNHLVGRVRQELIRVRELSQRDPLTGATNRRYFGELAEVELARLARNGRPLSLAYIDLDNFKTVNDSMGHEAGDQVLTTVVRLMRENLRRPDVVARIGGDEFLLMMPETGLSQAQSVLQRLLEACRTKMEENGWPIGMSIGAITTDQPAELEDLIRGADAQMYISKQSGKNRAS